jgi:hypothetical protein
MIEWRKIKGFENYEISSNGRMRLSTYGILKLQTDVEGYKMVGLTRNGVRYMRKIHRLVLQTFVSEPPLGFVTDHINRDRADNRVENLRWVSRSDSNRNKNGIRGVREHRGKFIAYARVNRIWTTLGRFTTYKEARKCREAFANALGFPL